MKKYKDSTLMAMTKKDLIEYIRMLEYNYEVKEETLNQQAKNIQMIFKNILERLEALAEEHPYKVQGDYDTYSQYNEAWETCSDRAIQIVEKRGGVNDSTESN